MLEKLLAIKLLKNIVGCMNRYLIFRTDRIGDFIFSRIITDAIKKKNSSNIIDFVCSSYNANYVRNFKDINKIFILDKYNLNLMIKNLIAINSEKYDYLIVLDGKRRSIFFSLLLSAKYKIAVLKDWRPFLLLKLFYDKFIINSEVKSQYNNFTSLANLIDLKISKNIDYYKSYRFKKKSKYIIPSNFILLHLDEKWFEGYYYKDFTYMNLNKKSFDLLIKTIFDKFKIPIIMTSGYTKVPILNEIIKKNFIKIKDDEFVSKKYKNRLQFFDNTDFQDIELIVKKSKAIICCEGAISHISHSFGKITYALIHNINIATFWTNHMPKIKLITRNKISYICKDLKKI